MRYIINDKQYHFKSAFDTETGAYVRTGILDEHGKDTGVDPFMATYPHLINVGIMGPCIHGKTGLCAKAGIGCYQSGLLVEQPNMSVDDFRWIAEQSKGKCNQFALGGRGDPDQHEHFEEILKICRENVLVPNFTTSGYGMTPEIARLCKPNKEQMAIDIEKLCYYTSHDNEYKYSFGFAIWLYKRNWATIKIFQNGKEMGALCYKWSLKL